MTDVLFVLRTNTSNRNVVYAISTNVNAIKQKNKQFAPFKHEH